MKKPLKIISLLMISLAIIYLSGPQVEIDTTLQPLDLPTDLDAYLATSESAYTDITPNTEKVIVWAGESGKKTPYSIVYFHGYSATRQETAPLTKSIGDRLNANIFYTRFAGHGRSGDALAEASINDWVNDAQEAYEIGKRLGEKVIIIGVSTGGTLAAWLATQPNISIATMVLISPNFGVQNASASLLAQPWGKQLAELLIGEERQWKALNPQQKHFWTTRYPTRALLPLMGLLKLVNSQNFSEIKCPTLMIYSQKDKVISPIAAETAFAKIGAVKKEMVVFNRSDDPSHHVIAGDIMSPNSTQAVADIIISFVGSVLHK